MSNTQSNHRNKRTAMAQGVISGHTFKECKPLLMVVHTQGSSLTSKDSKTQNPQGGTTQGSKDVALAAKLAKSGSMSLGCSFPVGLFRLPVVGGLPL